jgi:hypothetical protein
MSGSCQVLTSEGCRDCELDDQYVCPDALASGYSFCYAILFFYFDMCVANCVMLRNASNVGTRQNSEIRSPSKHPRNHYWRSFHTALMFTPF